MISPCLTGTWRVVGNSLISHHPRVIAFRRPTLSRSPYMTSCWLRAHPSKATRQQLAKLEGSSSTRGHCSQPPLPRPTSQCPTPAMKTERKVHPLGTSHHGLPRLHLAAQLLQARMLKRRAAAPHHSPKCLKASMQAPLLPHATPAWMYAWHSKQVPAGTLRNAYP